MRILNSSLVENYLCATLSGCGDKYYFLKSMAGKVTEAYLEISRDESEIHANPIGDEDILKRINVRFSNVRP